MRQINGTSNCFHSYSCNARRAPTFSPLANEEMFLTKMSRSAGRTDFFFARRTMSNALEIGSSSDRAIVVKSGAKKCLCFGPWKRLKNQH